MLRFDPSFHVYSETKALLEGSFCEIGSFAKIQGGFAFKSNEYQSQGIPLVRIQNLQNGVVGLNR